MYAIQHACSCFSDSQRPRGCPGREVCLHSSKLHVLTVQAVLHDNLQLLKACHLLDPTYFTFVMAVVKASSEMYSHKFRRTGKGMFLSAYSMCKQGYSVWHHIATDARFGRTD